MSREERQEALERLGLTETELGYVLTVEGFRRASRRAVELRAGGDPEAAEMLALDPSDERRWEIAKAIQLDALSREG
jgi:hypothetical protein